MKQVLLPGRTGHSHVLETVGECRVTRPTEAGSHGFVIGQFELAAPAAVTHETHRTVSLPPGHHVAVQQQEYDPWQQQMMPVFD